MKLPNGTSVNIEKSSFLTAEEASKTRKQFLIDLAYQDCGDVSRSSEDAFNEFNLRHTHASFLAAMNCPLVKLMKRMAHSKTKKHLRMLPELQLLYGETV